jgi:hypothetical protein
LAPILLAFISGIFPKFRGLRKEGDMVFLVSALAYLLFIVLICMFLKGASLLESPKPPLDDEGINPLRPGQLEAHSTLVLKCKYFWEWSGKVYLLAPPLAQPDQRGAEWKSRTDSIRP